MHVIFFFLRLEALTAEGLYEPFDPQRGVYFSAGEIKRIEVVGHPLPNVGAAT